MSTNGIQHSTTSGRRSGIGTTSFSSLCELSDQGNKRTQPSMLLREPKHYGSRQWEDIHPVVVDSWCHTVVSHDIRTPRNNTPIQYYTSKVLFQKIISTLQRLCLSRQLSPIQTTRKRIRKASSAACRNSTMEWSMYRSDWTVGDSSEWKHLWIQSTNLYWSSNQHSWVLIRITNKTMSHVAEQFKNSWLSRYPRPNRCVHDNGKEFIGSNFVRLLAQMGIKDVCTAVRNPQSNTICERIH